MNLVECIQRIQPADKNAALAAQKRWDSIAKPLRSLGLLEESIIRIAGMTGSPNIESLKPRGVIVMCADNGVVAEGGDADGPEVTAIVTENMSTGDTSVCHMAQIAQADIFPVDIGVAVPVSGTHILQHNIPPGHR